MSPESRVVGTHVVTLHVLAPEVAKAYYAALLPASGVADGLRFEVGPGPRWTVTFAAGDSSRVAERARRSGARSVTLLAGEAEIVGPRGETFRVSDAEPSAAGVVDGVLVLADLYTRDVEEATGFYTDVFALPVDELTDDPVSYFQLTDEGRHIAGILEMTSFLPRDVPEQWIPYFAFADVDAATARAASIGGRVVAPPSSSPTGRYALVRDPGGAMFGLWDAASLRR